MAVWANLWLNTCHRILLILSLKPESLLNRQNKARCELLWLLHDQVIARRCSAPRLSLSKDPAEESKNRCAIVALVDCSSWMVVRFTTIVPPNRPPQATIVFRRCYIAIALPRAASREAPRISLTTMIQFQPSVRILLGI